jgi:hypothetical protein
VAKLMGALIADGVEITVEVGFSTTAGNNTVPIGSTLSSITYTDVSTYVRKVSIKRGRSSELDDFTTGSCQVMFSNEDRRFDPENSAGPYYGELTPGRPIRIQATASGGSAQTIFQGYVDQWDQQYTNPSDAVAVVTASDAFKILNRLTLSSFWEYQVRNRGLAKYWLRLNEPTGSSSVFDSLQFGKVGDYRIPGSEDIATSVSAASLIANDTNTSAVFDGTKAVRIPSSAISAGPIVSFWIQTDTTTTGSYGIYTFFAGSGRFPTCIGMDVAAGVGTIRVSFTQTQFGTFPGTTSTLISSMTVNDGKPHHIMFGTSIVAGDPVDLYVDGVKATTTGTSADWKGTVSVEQCGIARTFSIDTSANSGIDFTSNFIGTVDEIVGYEIGGVDPITATDVSTNYAIGNGTYLSGNTSAQRLATLLEMADWMSDGETFSTATSTVQSVDTENKTVLAALKECETADQGRLFCDRSGLVKFISHDAMTTTSTYNTSQRTFGDGTGELPYLDLEFNYNDQLIFNREIISRNNGATVTVNDTTSQGQYFIRTDSLSGLINDTDDQITDIARARLATYKQPQLRIDQMTFSPRRLISMYAATITDDIGTRITVKRRPQGVGSVISKELIIEGISHDIDVSSWVTTYNLSPAPLPYLILDDTTFGVMDSTNLLGF